jgi:hypothetical protein
VYLTGIFSPFANVVLVNEKVDDMGVFDTGAAACVVLTELIQPLVARIKNERRITEKAMSLVINAGLTVDLLVPVLKVTYLEYSMVRGRKYRKTHLVIKRSFSNNLGL